MEKNSKSKRIIAFILVICLIFLVALTFTIFIKEKGAPEIEVLRGLNKVSLGGEGYEFKNTAVNYVSSETLFIIYNNGSSDLIVENIYFTEGDINHFVLGSPELPIKIEKGNYVGFSLAFSPRSVGFKKAVVAIINNDPDEGMYTFNITGTAIAAPSPENVRALAENERVTITWDNVASAISYNIYWSKTPGVSKSTGNIIRNVTSPYVHSNLTNGVTYYYIVTAKNAHGEGAESIEVSAKPGKTYYVDYRNGDDANNGLTPETAWKTLDKVNSMIFKPGEHILFKRGGLWHGRLEIRSSGSKGNPITFGAYGEGDKPILIGRGSVSGWDNPFNWTRCGKNIWRIYYGPYKIASRVWLSGVEYTKAQTLADVNETYRWYFDYENSWLYVYAESNPALYYSNIEESMALEGVVIRILNQKYVNIRDLDVRGGRASIEIIASSHIIIEDCNIGLYAGHIGIWISGNYWEPDKTPSNYGIIRRCIIDSGYRLSYYYEKAQTEDGIHMRNNVNYWEIYDNVIVDWGHSGIDLWQELENTTVSFNKIYSNFITSKDISYGRGFAIKGREGGAQFNEFYGNIIQDTTVGNEVGGDHNLICYNIIWKVKTTSVYSASSNLSPGIALTPAFSGNPDYVSNYNKIYNNVICEADGAGIEVRGWPKGYSIRYNEIKNNIIYNCGKNSDYEGHRNIGLYVFPIGWGEDATATATENIFQNNIIYNEGAENIVSYNGTAMTVEIFNSMNGTFNNIISGNLQLDPKFINADYGIFMLQYFSPAIDAGVDVGLTKDFEGIAVPQGKSVDIGAFEFH